MDGEGDVLLGRLECEGRAAEEKEEGAFDVDVGGGNGGVRGDVKRSSGGLNACSVEDPDEENVMAGREGGVFSPDESLEGVRDGGFGGKFFSCNLSGEDGGV